MFQTNAVEQMIGNTGLAAKEGTKREKETMGLRK